MNWRPLSSGRYYREGCARSTRPETACWRAVGRDRLDLGANSEESQSRFRKGRGASSVELRVVGEDR